MTIYAKTASGLGQQYIQVSRDGAVDSQNICKFSIITTTAENGRIKAMISREEAIFELSLVKEVVLDPDLHSRTVEAVDMAIEALSQPERPKGRWDKPSLHGLNGKLNDLGVICSHCLKYADTDYDFCPNCGAKMER